MGAGTEENGQHQPYHTFFYYNFHITASLFPVKDKNEIILTAFIEKIKRKYSLD
jgi:hypothetical protein